MFTRKSRTNHRDVRIVRSGVTRPEHTLRDRTRPGITMVMTSELPWITVLDHTGSHKDVHPITPAPNHQDLSRLRISRITSGSTPDHIRINSGSRPDHGSTQDHVRITSGSRPDQLWITSGSRPRISGSHGITSGSPSGSTPQLRILELLNVNW